MMFKSVTPAIFSLECFSLYRYAAILLLFITGVGIIISSYDGIPYFINSLLLFVFIALVAAATSDARFRRHPLGNIFGFFIITFFAIPAAFVAVLGSSYLYGVGVSSLPYTQDDYVRHLPFNIILLTLNCVTAFLGIRASPFLVQQKPATYTRFNINKAIVLGLFVAYLTVIDLLNIAKVRDAVGSPSTDGGKPETLLGFVFWDAAYISLFGLILCLHNLTSNWRENGLTRALTLIFMIFVITGVFGGSKGSIMIVFILVAFLPSVVAASYENSRAFILDRKVLIILSVPALVFFAFSEIQRLPISSQDSSRSELYMAAVQQFDLAKLNAVINQIGYRLSWGGYDRLILIQESFIEKGHDLGFTADYVAYLAKNFINLVLPGTPYLEAYMPSSQLFSSILHRDILDGASTQGDFLRNVNTQPSTIFGVLVVVFGGFSVFASFTFFFLISFAFNMARNPVLKLAISFLFIGALGAFGIETTLASATHFLISCVIMVIIVSPPSFLYHIFTFIGKQNGRV